MIIMLILGQVRFSENLHASVSESTCMVERLPFCTVQLVNTFDLVDSFPSIPLISFLNRIDRTIFNVYLHSR